MKQTILKLLLFINSILLIAYMGLTAHADFHLNTRGVIPLFLSSLLLIDVTYVSSCNITMKQKLPGSQKKRKLPLIKLLIVYFELNWQAYAATIGASQPSVFNFFRYAFILRSLLN